MSVVEYLSRYSTAKIEILFLSNQLEALERSLDSVLCFSDRIGSKSGSDPMRRERILAEIADTQKDIQEKINGLDIIGLDILDTISRISDPVLSARLMDAYIYDDAAANIRDRATLYKSLDAVEAVLKAKGIEIEKPKFAI